MAAAAASKRSFSDPAASQCGLTPEMAVVTDMLYTHGPRLAQEVNRALAARGHPPRRFVSNIIEKVQDPDISAGHKADMLAALETALRPYMAPDASLDVLMSEWMTAVVWMDMQYACAHPLPGRLEKDGGVAELRQLASSKPEYEPVRLLVSTLLNANEQLEQAPPVPPV